MPCMRVTVIPFYVKRKGRKVYKFLIKWTEPKFWFGAVRWKVENSDLAHFSDETTKVKKVGLKSFQISNKMNCCSLFIDVKRLKVFIYIVIFVWFPIFLTGITLLTPTELNREIHTTFDLRKISTWKLMHCVVQSTYQLHFGQFDASLQHRAGP